MKLKILLGALLILLFTSEIADAQRHRRNRHYRRHAPAVVIVPPRPVVVVHPHHAPRYRRAHARPHYRRAHHYNRGHRHHHYAGPRRGHARRW